MTANPFVVFMSNLAGRTIRVIAGAILVLVGFFAFGPGVARDIVVAVGAVIFLAGALNFCLIAPFFRAPFLGKDVR
jgi:hypothetical protein